MIPLSVKERRLYPLLRKTAAPKAVSRNKATRFSPRHYQKPKRSATSSNLSKSPSRNLFHETSIRWADLCSSQMSQHRTCFRLRQSFEPRRIRHSILLRCQLLIKHRFLQTSALQLIKLKSMGSQRTAAKDAKKRKWLRACSRFSFLSHQSRITCRAFSSKKVREINLTARHLLQAASTTWETSGSKTPQSTEAWTAATRDAALMSAFPSQAKKAWETSWKRANGHLRASSQTITKAHLTTAPLTRR